MFAKALATIGGCIFIKISPDDILNEFIGKSEERMRGCISRGKRKGCGNWQNSCIIHRRV